MEFLFIGVILTVLPFFLQISACYECLPRSAVQKFVSLCPLCSSQKLQHNQAAEAHHIASGFMSRGQVSINFMYCKIRLRVLYLFVFL